MAPWDISDDDSDTSEETPFSTVSHGIWHFDVEAMIQDFTSSFIDAIKVKADFNRNGIEVEDEFHQNGSDVAFECPLPEPPEPFPLCQWKTIKKPQPGPQVPSPQVPTLTSPPARRKIPVSKGKKSGQKSKASFCVFCCNNGQEPEVYMGHQTHDADGSAICPYLRSLVCPICGATGERAHTKKYCPQKPIITPDDLKWLDKRTLNCIL